MPGRSLENHFAPVEPTRRNDPTRPPRAAHRPLLDVQLDVAPGSAPFAQGRSFLAGRATSRETRRHESARSHDRGDCFDRRATPSEPS